MFFMNYNTLVTLTCEEGIYFVRKYVNGKVVFVQSFTNEKNKLTYAKRKFNSTCLSIIDKYGKLEG